MSFEIYSLASDFSSGVDVTQLSDEVSASIATFDYVMISGDDVYIVFTAPISAGEKTTLDGIVASHSPGSAFDPDTVLATVQLRKTINLTPTASYANITFDTKDYENYTPFLEHNTSNTERIDVKEAGSYRVSYFGNVITERVDFRVLRNNVSLVQGSEFHIVHTGTNEGFISCGCVADLVNGDFLTLQAKSSTGGEILANLVFLVHANKGIKGEVGPTGSTGAPGPSGSTGPPGPAGPGTGDVLSTGTSTDNAVVRFNLETGTSIQNSGVIVDDGNNVTGIGTLNANFMNIANSTIGNNNHISLQLLNTFTADTYNFGLDTTIGERLIATSQNGLERQATLLLSDSSDGLSTIFGISSSNNSGVTWNSLLAITHGGKIGINNNSPTEILDVDGNMNITGTINGRNITSDGVTLDALASTAGGSDLTKINLFDDFFGTEIPDNWLCETTGVSDVRMVDVYPGVIQIIGTDVSNYGEINTLYSLVDITKNAIIQMRVKLSQLTNSIVEFGCKSDSNNLVRFVFPGSGSWEAQNISSGASISTNISLASDPNWHNWKIECSSSDIKFYFDDTLKATHTTNLPTTVMQLYIRVTSINSGAKDCFIDFVKLSADR